MCGKDRPKQNSGSMQTGSGVVHVADSTQPADETTSFGVVPEDRSNNGLLKLVRSHSPPFPDILFCAYLLLSLLLLISSRRFRPHLGDPSGLSINFDWADDRRSSIDVCWSALRWPPLADVVPWNSVNSSSGTRLMACSTPTRRLCNSWGSSSASISRAIGLNIVRSGSSWW